MERSLSRVTALKSQYEEVRKRTDALVVPLSDEDQLVQSMADVSPTKWHRAHTTWFFETFVLSPYQSGYVEVDPSYSYLFNSYYEAVGPRQPRAERGVLSRPSVAQIASYRQSIDSSMSGFFADLDDDDSEILDLIELGIQHEQQHQELLLMDIKHVFWTHPMHPVYSYELEEIGLARSPSALAPLNWTSLDGGLIDIGHSKLGFSFDNELPKHQTVVNEFQIADRLITCGEWLEFINAGGYETAGLWLSDGWQTLNTKEWHAPLYWFEDEGDWKVFTLGGSRAVRPDEPVVHVSYYEADAFARWSGTRLPTEFEWEHAARDLRVDGNFIEAGVLHPIPGTGLGLQQMFGDAWEWTASSYSPYPGFTPTADAVGEYNGKFMINQMVLKGGASVTPREHIRLTYRNFFPAAARWHFGSVRLARGG